MSEGQQAGRKLKAARIKRNPEPGFQSGPGDSANADLMAPFLLVTKSSPPSGGGSEKKTLELGF